jgi:hypothetical protein
MLCLTEHHVNREELQHTFIEDYNLGAYFCRKSCAKGSVCTYVHESLNFENMDLETYYIEKDFEVCALKLNLNLTQTCTITKYRAPSGNFNLFVNELDLIFRNLYNPTLEYIICGDINIDYLTNNGKNQLEALLLTYNLTSTGNFSTRCKKNHLLLLTIFSLILIEKIITLYVQ